MSSLIINKNINMYSKLSDCIKRANKIYFNVSFVKDSGIKLILKDLKKAVEENKEIKILTSDYMKVTEPNALYRLVELSEKNVKLYNNVQNKSFHPKTYIFEYENNEGEVIIGSSNISFSALVDGIEWNYSMKKSENKDTFEEILKEFNELYDENSFELTLQWLRNYEKSYVKREKEIIRNTEKSDFIIEPIKFQIPALYELSKTREEGYNKAMVIVATGLGKTYLSAFDSLNYKKVLFIAHRDEILQQAKSTFEKVHIDKKMDFFNGQRKKTDVDILFASIQTIGKETYLCEEYFSRDYFDYIVVDEAHHSTAISYEKVLNYFTPKFLLGITATPERMDNKDVYKICDYNIAYECDFRVGINNGWLVPFKYYGIYDDIDYIDIPWRNGKYDLEILENKLNVEKRAEDILKKYKLYGRDKTIGFCAGVRHTDFMEKFFNKKGIKAKSILADTKLQDRKQIIDDFINGDIKVIFTVDIFNEGVDIPVIDTVMFLRPTTSYTIFIQQLGRGLRTKEGKENLVVMDFVGNYNGSELRTLFLSGNYKHGDIKQKAILPTDNNFILPEGCSANFDLNLIDIFKKKIDNKLVLKERLIIEYNRIKEEINRVPTIMDMYTESCYPVSIYINEYKGWINFLESVNSLNDKQKEYKTTKVFDFLFELEKSAMSKSYKIPTILSFIENGKLLQKISVNKVAEKFREFYNDELHGKDLNDKKHKEWRNWKLKDFEKLAVENPIKHLSKEFFKYDSQNREFEIIEEVYNDLEKYYIVDEILDRIEYRKTNYFSRKYGSENS